MTDFEPQAISIEPMSDWRSFTDQLQSGNLNSLHLRSNFLVGRPLFRLFMDRYETHCRDHAYI